MALAAALRRFRPDESWSVARAGSTTGTSRTNGNLCLDEGRRLAAGDVIKLWTTSRQAPPRPEDVKIVYRDVHLVVVEKPAGVTTTRHREEVSLAVAAEAIAADLGRDRGPHPPPAAAATQTSSRGPLGLRPAGPCAAGPSVVADTSGVMLLAAAEASGSLSAIRNRNQ